MKEKILALLQSKSDVELLEGLKLLIEISRNEPSQLDPITLVLISRIVKPFTNEVVYGLKAEKTSGNA